MRIILTLLSILFSLGSFGQIKKDISLEAIWKNYTFYPNTLGGFKHLKNGQTYSIIEMNRVNQSIEVNSYNYQKKQKLKTLISSTELAKDNGLKNFIFSDYQFNSSETKAILSTQVEKIYRHSSKAIFYLWNEDNNKLTKLRDEKIMYATFSPDDTKIAYVLENNLWVYNLYQNKHQQLTKDGKVNHIINGAVDWVYEEEFSMDRGFFWNANGSQIAYYKFDESHVKQWQMKKFGELYPKFNRFKYPKAGEKNSIVRVFVANLKNGKSKEIELQAENDQYIPRIKWTKEANILSIQRLNRQQNYWELIMANTSKNTQKIVLTEKNKRYIDMHDDLYFLDDLEHFILKSERDGFWHIYLHKNNGPQVFQTTKGKWEVDELVGIDEKRELIYFTSTEKSPLERHIYSIGFDGSNKKQISKTKGTHHAELSKNGNILYHHYSSFTEPSKYYFRTTKGSIVRTLEENTEFIENLDSYKLSEPQFSQIDLGYEKLNYWMIKPQNFDSTKKYPMLMHVYGGPGSQTVSNSWGWFNYFWHQMLANRYGIIVVSVDGRGTGARGDLFKKQTYLQLGKYEIEDQINAAIELGKLPYINPNRIGMWGWSFGGYMSSLAITKGHHVFSTAIAVAPVTNWRFYDNIYTERFMRTPQENGLNYDINSPINHVDSIDGKYLIIHGTGDDNVHFQNAAEMVNSMIQKNISFDSEFYPNKSHGISGGLTRLHLYTRMTNFLLENL